MSIKYSPEKLEFQDSLRSFFSERATPEYLRQRTAAKKSDPSLLAAIAELGLDEYFADLPKGELGVHDLALVALESGRALLPEDLAIRLLLGPVLKRLLEKDGALASDVKKFLGEGKSGSLAVVNSSETAISVAGDLSGSIPAAAGFGESDFQVLVFEDLRRAFLLSLGKGAIAPETSLDETMRLFSAKLKNEKALEIKAGAADKLLSAVYALRSSELAGAAARAVQMTVDYVKTRKQYGVPVGGFQAVQHKLADMHLQAEAMRAISNFACWAADNSPDQFELAALSAIKFTSKEAPLCVEAAIQLHGGIGFTYEFDLHLYLRRVKALSILFAPSHGADERILELAAL